MKQFRLLGMALLALIMSVGFVACSSSDDDDNKGSSITSGKKLVRMTEDEGYSKSTITFSYNSNGQLIKAGNTDEYISLDWTSNSIVLSTYSKYFKEPNVDITLKDNKITDNKTTDSGFEYSFKYSGNYLMSFIEFDVEESTKYNHKLTWENGNITKTDDGQGNIRIATYYEDKVNKHPTVDVEALRLYDAIPAEWGNLLYLAHPSLFGISNKNLIKSVKHIDSYSSEATVVNYSYELDSEGYPTKITATGIEGNNSIVYTLTWE